MLQETKWERQLPVSWPASCTLPCCKIHSESSSVVVLPVLWHYTCCLKIMLVIFQKWWHEITHAVSFFPENVQFFLLLKKKKKEKALWTKLVLFHSQTSWSGRISCVTSSSTESTGLTQELLPTVSLHRDDGSSARLRIWPLASYLWMCILAYTGRIFKEFCSWAGIAMRTSIKIRVDTVSELLAGDSAVTQLPLQQRSSTVPTTGQTKAERPGQREARAKGSQFK